MEFIIENAATIATVFFVIAFCFIAFYALRKTTIEPTFGIIKEVMGFRRFSLRGLDLVKGEWTLVSIAYNLKKLCALNLKIA